MPRTVILTASGLPCRLRKSTSSIVELAGCLIGYIMVGKTAPIRPEDAERMDRIHKYCGCLPCLICGVADVHTTIEHVTQHGRRINGSEQHQWTIGLCPYHHFGKPLDDWQNLPGSLGGALQATSGLLGPSLAWGRKPFEEHFGDEVTVLVPTQNFMLAEFDRHPWGEYAVPRIVAREVRQVWMTLYAGPSQFFVES